MPTSASLYSASRPPARKSDNRDCSTGVNSERPVRITLAPTLPDPIARATIRPNPPRPPVTRYTPPLFQTGTGSETTGITNLGQPCPKHHKLRHTTGWIPTPATKDEPPGWTSPTGRHYKSEHQDWEPPHWPDLLEEPDTPPWPDNPDWAGNPLWPDDPEPNNLEGLGPALPVDPFPEWADCIAA